MRAAEAEGARGERERETKKSESLLVNSDLCSFEGAGRGSEPSGEDAERKRRERSKADEKRGERPEGKFPVTIA